METQELEKQVIHELFWDLLASAHLAGRRSLGVSRVCGGRGELLGQNILKSLPQNLGVKLGMGRVS